MPATAIAPLAQTRWSALGTTVVLRLSPPPSAGAAAGARIAAGARAAAAAELDAIDLACSRFRADSELSRLNARAGLPTPVGELLLEALQLALRAAALSDGDVDPTIGGALIAVGYDRDWDELAGRARRASGGSGARRPAHSAAIVQPRLRFRRAGWSQVDVDEDRGTVTVPGGLQLDLGATAKAWAADRAAAAAALATGCGSLVAIGGDIATAGAGPGEGWQVRVTDDHRRGDPDLPGQTVTIAGGGLATSSTTVRRWATDAGEAHHLIDPRSGRPARGPWRTVTVAAGTCADANIASTAAIVRGRRARAWLERQGLPARLVDHSGNATEVAGWPSP
jgi:thiamine biosynthesis lipoprotein